MKVVVDRLVQYPNRYTLTNVSTGAVLGTFDFEESTGTVQQVGTEINKELFDSIADDLATRVKLDGGNASALVVDFPDTTTVENITTGTTIKTAFSRLSSWFTNRIAKLKAFAYTDTKIAKSDIADGVIPPVVQATGTSTSNVMSQSATTSAVNTALSTAKTYAETTVQDAITQQTGNDTNVVMSQSATTTALNTKVDKVSGKQLSTNDYTTAEKTKLAGIAESANNYVLPVATSSALGGVKSGNDISISTTGLVTVLDNSHNHTIANVTDLQATLDAKYVKPSTGIPLTDLASAVQTEIGKIATIPTTYAGSSTAGGSATSAVKLDTATAGSATQPVYFSGGKPVATTYTLGASVPSGAKFTDTTYSVATQSANGLMSASDKKKLDTNVVTLDGTQTITGVKTFNAPTNVASTEQVTAWFNTANGGRIGFGKEQDNSGTGIFFDQVSGTRRLNFRASATAGAMVWEQPEKGAVLYVDLGAKDSDYHRITFPSSAGTLALTSQITKSQVGLSNVANVLQYSASNPNFGTATPLMDGTGAVGTATTYARSDHRHPTDTSRASTAVATTSTAGLMSSADKSKLDGIASGANNYTLPTASSSTLGGVKTTSTVTSATGYTACPIISGVPYYKDTNTTYTFSANAPTLAWGTTSTIGTAGGTTYTVTMPANPNTDTGATSVAVSGSGNAVTTASYDASTRKLTLTKGTTFLTSHQDISGKANLSGATFTGLVNFNAGGTIAAGKTLTLAGTSNSGAANIKFGTVNSKNPYFGYALDQTDGTFVWSITGTNYASGLAIGGGNENLLWKGTKVATISDIPSYSVATSSANGLMSSTDKSKLDGITASADSVSFTRSLTSGTKIGTITINGTATDLYAPSSTSVTLYNHTIKITNIASGTAEFYFSFISKQSSAFTTLSNVYTYAPTTNILAGKATLQGQLRTVAYLVFNSSSSLNLYYWSALGSISYITVTASPTFTDVVKVIN